MGRTETQKMTSAKMETTATNTSRVLSPKQTIDPTPDPLSMFQETWLQQLPESLPHQFTATRKGFSTGLKNPSKGQAPVAQSYKPSYSRGRD
jgi:hypothetical protein